MVHFHLYSSVHSRSVGSDSLTLWAVVHQAPLSMGLSRQKYWSGFPFLPPGDLSDSGIEPAFLVSPALQVDSLSAEPFLGQFHSEYEILHVEELISRSWWFLLGAYARIKYINFQSFIFSIFSSWPKTLYILSSQEFICLFATLRPTDLEHCSEKGEMTVVWSLCLDHVFKFPSWLNVQVLKEQGTGLCGSKEYLVAYFQAQFLSFHPRAF